MKNKRKSDFMHFTKMYGLHDNLRVYKENVSYAELDSYLNGNIIEENKVKIVERMHSLSEHKRKY